MAETGFCAHMQLSSMQLSDTVCVDFLTIY